jgi:DNA-binding SARP family transcriptional activator
MIEAAVAWLEEQRLAALEMCLDLELGLGDHQQLCAELQQLVWQWPLRERLVGQLMLALYRSGRQADALDAFHRLGQRLRTDLGILPSIKVAQLHQAILRQDPTLDPAQPNRAPPWRPGNDPANARKTPAWMPTA